MFGRNIQIICENNFDRNTHFGQMDILFALKNAIYNMDSAYQKFFKEHTGYPKFKSKYEIHKSYTTNYTNGNIVVDYESGKIKLPK